MKIRDLKWRELPMWPPEWVSDQQVGEEGVLKAVQLRDEFSIRLLSIEANHLGDYRKGLLLMEDPAQLELVFDTLLNNLGRPLTEIGNLEIDLSLQKYGPKQARPKPAARNKKRVVNQK